MDSTTVCDGTITPRLELKKCQEELKTTKTTHHHQSKLFQFRLTTRSRLVADTVGSLPFPYGSNNSLTVLLRDLQPSAALGGREKAEPHVTQRATNNSGSVPEGLSVKGYFQNKILFSIQKTLFTHCLWTPTPNYGRVLWQEVRHRLPPQSGSTSYQFTCQRIEQINLRGGCFSTNLWTTPTPSPGGFNSPAPTSDP